MNLSELTDKELAVMLAEKLGYDHCAVLHELLKIALRNGNEEQVLNDWLQGQASQILFSEGMAGKIDSYLFKHLVSGTNVPEYVQGINADIEHQIRIWWRTLTPRKIIEVYLEMEQPVKVE